MSSTPYQFKTRRAPKKLRDNCDLSGFQTLNLRNPNDFPASESKTSSSQGGPPSLSPSSSQDSESNDCPSTPEKQFSANQIISPATANVNDVDQSQHLSSSDPPWIYMSQDYAAFTCQSHPSAKPSAQVPVNSASITSFPTRAANPSYVPPSHPPTGTPNYFISTSGLVPTSITRVPPNSQQFGLSQYGQPHDHYSYEGKYLYDQQQNTAGKEEK